MHADLLLQVMIRQVNQAADRRQPEGQIRIPGRPTWGRLMSIRALHQFVEGQAYGGFDPVQQVIFCTRSSSGSPETSAGSVHRSVTVSRA